MKKCLIEASKLPSDLINLILQYFPKKEYLIREWKIKNVSDFTWLGDQLCILDSVNLEVKIHSVDGKLIRDRKLSFSDKEKSAIERCRPYEDRPLEKYKLRPINIISSGSMILITDEGVGNSIRTLDDRLYNQESPEVFRKFACPHSVVIMNDKVYILANHPYYSLFIINKEEKIIRQWGREFIDIQAFSVSKDGDIYLLEAGGSCVYVFSENKKLRRKWNVFQDERPSEEAGIVVHENEVYVFNTCKQDIRIFSTAGKYLRKWRSCEEYDKISISPQGKIAVYNTFSWRMMIFEKGFN